MSTQPIGVLDSGVGGLTVLREIIDELPLESVIYIGDSMHIPYGELSSEKIFHLSEKLIHFLLQKNVKLIVIACNTITVNAIDRLRASFPMVPIIGTVPVVKTAVAVTRNKKIGVLVTGATALSAYNTRLLEEFAYDCMITVVGTNKLVPLIEEKETELLEEVLEKELAPFKRAKVDTVILGSTHFPIIRKQISDILGPSVTLLDSAGAVTRQIKRILLNNHILTESDQPGLRFLYTTGNNWSFINIAESIFQQHITVEHVVLE